MFGDNIRDLASTGHKKKPLLPHDEEMAAAFVAQYGDQLRYCQDLGGWLTWDGSYYQHDQRLSILERAQAFCAGEAARLKAKSLAGRKRIDAVVHLARARESIATEAKDWDADPDILCTPGGILELPTGLLRPATPADYCTRRTLVTPKGDCPRFLKVLHEIFLDQPSLIPFLQVFCGYCLSGHDKERKFVFAYGGGNNGKDTAFSLLQALMGSYAGTVPTETLLSSKSDRHPTEVAMRRGLRLGVASETPKTRKWNEARVKLLTGGGRISARFMNGNFFDFPMTAKLVVYGNELPILTSLDDAWRDRMLFLYFNQQFTGKRAIKGLKEDLIAREGPGILAWAAQGSVTWYAEGLVVPPEITAATNAYMAEQDVRGRWLAECIDTSNPSAETTTIALFESWSRWAESEKEYVGTPTALTRELNKRFPGKYQKREKCRVFIGLKVREVDASI